MIKLFRYKRQNLISKNKTGKYLKYAIGEIVLIVTGILIALQITNWNNQKLANDQMTSFLIGIKEDLKSDTLQYAGIIRFFNRLVDQKKGILSSSNFNELSVDSLFMIVRPRVVNYEINSTTFDQIKNSGFTQISSNQSLSKNLYEYYTATDIELKGYLKWDSEGSTAAQNYWYYGHNLFEVNMDVYNLKDTDEIKTFQNDSISKRNLIHLISEPRGRNYIKHEYFRKQTISNNLLVLKERATNLIIEIENELNTNK